MTPLLQITRACVHLLPNVLISFDPEEEVNSTKNGKLVANKGSKVKGLVFEELDLQEIKLSTFGFFSKFV